jgi:hypothetical protein
MPHYVSKESSSEKYGAIFTGEAEPPPEPSTYIEPKTAQADICM